MCVLGTLGIPTTHSENLEVKAIFPIILRCYLPFSILFSQESALGNVLRAHVIEKLHDMWCHNRLEVEARRRIQLSPMKLDSKDICKNGKCLHGSCDSFALKNAGFENQNVKRNQDVIYINM